MIVGAGAQVLGPIIVGDGARIGANAVVLKDVPKGATMVGIPAKMVMGRGQGADRGVTVYGTPTEDLPDPILRSFESLRAQLNVLAKRVKELEVELEEAKPMGSSDVANDKGLSSSGG